MSYTYKYVKSGTPPYLKQEILLAEDASTSALPTDAPVGSIAYTPSLSHIWMWDGESWVEIGE